LQHGGGISCFFQFDNSNVLVLCFRNSYLQDKGMNIFISLVNYFYVIDISISVQVKIVYIFTFGVDQFFKFFNGR